MSGLNGFKLYLQYTLISLITSIIYISISLYFIKYSISFNFLHILKIILISELITFFILLYIFVKKQKFFNILSIKIYSAFIQIKIFIKKSLFFFNLRINFFI